MSEQSTKSGELQKRTRAFALQVMRFVESLPSTRGSDILGRQLFRSATSVGANYRSVCRAKSRADFIAKLAIVEEEADECQYWLDLMIEAELGNASLAAKLRQEAHEITAMVVASIKHARSQDLSRHSAFRTPHSPFPIGQQGQAMVELAIVGSFILMLLGVLMNYGLNYDHQQQARMTAFREGLKSAAASSDPEAPVSISHLLIQDRHHPNPADPFGVGAVVPATAQGSVTRRFNLQEFPSDVDELPRLAIQIQGAESCPGGGRIPPLPGNPPTCYYTLAGFRNEFDVPLGSLERYRFIYGTMCDKWEDCCEPSDGACKNQFSETCPGGVGEEPDPTGQQESRTYCPDPRKFVRILDPCEGEIINYTNCVSQAAQIVDTAACDAACQKAAAAGGEGLDCAKMCSQPMGEPPWYAKGAGCSGGRCTAPALDALFTGLLSMGVQEPTRVAFRNLTLNKRETASGITTTESGSWRDEITRRVVIQQGGRKNDQGAITTLKEQIVNE